MAKRDEVFGLSAKLKAARETAGLTQVEAAEKAGMAQANVSEFERGLKTPTLATLYKLAEAYGVEVAELLPPRIPAVPPPPPLPEPPKKPRKKS